MERDADRVDEGRPVTGRARGRGRLMGVGLRQRLLILILVILVPLLAMLAYNLYHFFDDLENDQVNLHARDARIVAATLDGFIHELAQVSKTAGLALAQSGVKGAAAQTYLRSVRTRVPVSNVAYLSTDGVVQSSALSSLVGKSLAAEPAFREALTSGGFAVSGLRRNESGELGFAVFTAVPDATGKTVGVSEVAVDAANLGMVVPSSITNGVVIITDSSGVLVYSNVPSLADLPLSDRFDFEAPGVRIALAGREYTTRSTTIPGLPGDWLGAQVPVAQTGWTDGLYDPSGTALQHVTTEAVISFLVVFFILAVSLIAARQYGKSITDPVEQLTAATAEIEQGRFDVEVPVTGHDEIAELATNFRRMQESLRHTLNDVAVLADSARWISSTLDLDAIAHATADYLERIIQARAVAVSLFDERRPKEAHVLAPGLDDQTAARLAEAGAAGAARVALDERTYAIVDVLPADELRELAPDARYLVMLPLVVSGKPIGRIDALAAPSAKRAEFEQTDIPLATSLAQQVAVAAENARLFEQQRAIADTLQDSLLTEPYNIPELDIGLVYYQATVGGRIGGDFYDFIPVSTRQTAIVIGDITGKGLEAARYTTIGKGTIRSFALEDPRPSEVMGRANRVIAEQLGAANFITAAYLLLDLDTGVTTYTVAGHPPPMLLRADGTLETFGIAGVPLGIEVAETYADETVTVGPGDRLLLYTDGLSEARRGKELFGIEQVGRAFSGFRGVPVRDVATGIAEAAIAFAGGALQDDLAIIVIDRCAPPEARGDARTPR